MAQQTTYVDPFDNDTFTIALTGPGTFTTTNSAQGLGLLQLTGSTLSSSLTITRASQVGDGLLTIERIAGQSLSALTLEDATVVLGTLAGAGTRSLDLTGYAKTITAGLIFAGDINLGTTSAGARTTIFARQIIDNTAADPVVIATGGVIDAFTCGQVNGASLTARRIGSVAITGNAGSNTRINITTTDTTATYGLKTFSSQRRLDDSTWSIAAPVQSIDLIDTTGFLSVPAINVTVAGRIGRLTCAEDLGGTFIARSFGQIRAAATMSANISTTDAVSNTANSIDSLVARALFLPNLTVPNGIGLLSAGLIAALANPGRSSITAGWIDTLNTTGPTLPLNFLPPETDITNTDIVLTNTARTSVLRSMSLTGGMGDSSFRANNNIGDVRMSYMNDSQFRVGVNPAVTGLPTAVADFSGNFQIRSFRFVQDPLNGTFTNFENSIVASRRFGLLRIDSPVVTTNNMGTDFGFVGDLFDRLTYKAGPGVSFDQTFVGLNSVVSVGDFLIAAL